MQIVINPKDNNTFASASLDRTVKVGIGHSGHYQTWPSLGFILALSLLKQFF